MREEIRRLSAANRERPDRATERRLLRLRHLAGLRLLDADAAARVSRAGRRRAASRAAARASLRADLTPGLVRAAILRDGCVLVRGLIDREDALALAGGIDRAFAERDGGGRAAGYYDEFVPEPPYEVAAVRPWIKEGGGVLAADSPLLLSRMLEAFEQAELPALVEGYLGERRCCPCTRRRCARPSRPWAARGTRTVRSWATRAR